MKVVFKFDRNVTEGLAKKFSKIDELILSRDDAAAISKEIVEEMKDMISKGISPIAGYGRFPAYKNPKEGYPATVRGQYPDKRTTPVNLKLTGDFLRALKGKVTQVGAKFKMVIGYFDPVEEEKEESHREGNRGQPKRPTLPIAAKGEKFAKRIETLYLEKVLKNVKKL